MQTQQARALAHRGLLSAGVVPPVPVPPGYVGPLALKGTGRMVYWTGRVAIGLRHEPVPAVREASDSERWLQDLLCSPAAAH